MLVFMSLLVSCKIKRYHLEKCTVMFHCFIMASNDYININLEHLFCTYLNIMVSRT